MTQLIINIIVRSIILGIVVKLVPGIRVRNVTSLVITAILLGVANAIIRPILIEISFPLIAISSGLFLIVINAAILKILDGLMGKKFEIDGWLPAIMGAIALSLVSWLIGWLLLSI